MAENNIPLWQQYINQYARRASRPTWGRPQQPPGWEYLANPQQSMPAVIPTDSAGSYSWADQNAYSVNPQTKERYLPGWKANPYSATGGVDARMPSYYAMSEGVVPDDWNFGGGGSGRDRWKSLARLSGNQNFLNLPTANELAQTYGSANIGGSSWFDTDTGTGTGTGTTKDEDDPDLYDPFDVGEPSVDQMRSSATGLIDPSKYGSDSIWSGIKEWTGKNPMKAAGIGLDLWKQINQNRALSQNKAYMDDVRKAMAFDQADVNRRWDLTMKDYNRRVALDDKFLESQKLPTAV
tara:strand:+ start:32062 stop:32943 length:882 start_codon:yes stop_codon:yes gene_type:complete